MHERRATALRRGSGSQVECPHFYTFARAGRITGHSDRTPHVSVTQPDNPAPCVCVSMPSRLRTLRSLSPRLRNLRSPCSSMNRNSSFNTRPGFKPHMPQVHTPRPSHLVVPLQEAVPPLGLKGSALSLSWSGRHAPTRERSTVGLRATTGLQTTDSANEASHSACLASAQPHAHVDTSCRLGSKENAHPARSRREARGALSGSERAVGAARLTA